MQQAYPNNLLLLRLHRTQKKGENDTIRSHEIQENTSLQFHTTEHNTKEKTDK